MTLLKHRLLTVSLILVFGLPFYLYTSDRQLNATDDLNSNDEWLSLRKELSEVASSQDALLFNFRLTVR